MKRIISAILICVICITSIPVVAYAEMAEFDNTLLGVIVDADGNVVEKIPMPRSVPEDVKYVDSIHTIPQNGSFISYQYYPQSFFELGFAFYDADDKYIVTTRDGKLHLEIFNAATIGGERKSVIDKTFSTNYEDLEDRWEYAWAFISTGILPYPDFYLDPSRPYYNGVITNKSNFPITTRILVLMR